MIISVTLAQGAKRMAHKKVIVEATGLHREFRQHGDPLQR